MIENILGDTIRVMRRAQKMSQTELATLIGIDATYVSRIESHKKNPTLPIVYKIAEAFKIHVSELFVEQAAEARKE
jgi:transcriptional regulator with XRE-family HTH domain